MAGIEAVPEDVSARVEGLELLCSFINGDTGPLKGQCGDHRLIVALTALFFVSASGMFPVAMPRSPTCCTCCSFIARATISRPMFPLCACSTVPTAPCAPKSAGATPAEADAPTLPFEPGDLAVEYDGTYDWTFVFERAVELILEEQRWVRPNSRA